MRLLIFGGTGFLGRFIVEAALARQHTITLFNRGLTNTELFPQLEQLHGDRNHDLKLLDERVWDAVIDTNGHIPRHVRASASFLAEKVEHYTFLSTTSVYANYRQVPMTENSPVRELEDPTIEELTPETYGGRKALAERYVEQILPGRVLVIRPGLVVGPHDTTDRFTYWPHRIAQGGEVLAPGDPEQPVQFIDVRDLAAWIIAMVEMRQAGIFNTKGPESTLTMRQFLEKCREVSGSDARFEWVSESFLLARQVAPYTQLPLWVPSEMKGFSRFDCSKALTAGLRFRPLMETIQDVLAWNTARLANYILRAGLTPDRERQLLNEWHSIQEKH